MVEATGLEAKTGWQRRRENELSGNGDRQRGSPDSRGTGDDHLARVPRPVAEAVVGGRSMALTTTIRPRCGQRSTICCKNGMLPRRWLPALLRATPKGRGASFR